MTGPGVTNRHCKKLLYLAVSQSGDLYAVAAQRYVMQKNLDDIVGTVVQGTRGQV